MKIRAGSPVILKSFLGDGEAPTAVPRHENFWSLIGSKGEVVKSEPGEKLVLVRFETDLGSLGLEEYDGMKNTLFILKSDLIIDEDRVRKMRLYEDKAELVSCMNDHKWYKLFSLLLDHKESIAYIKLKYILDDNVYDFDLQDEGDFDGVSLREKDDVVVTFKEIQYMMLYCSARDETEKSRLRESLARRIKSLGQYSMDIALDFIRIYGYEHHKGSEISIS